MQTTRLEFFSDAVIAIILTIMVLELHTPQAPTWSALQPLLPVFLAYVMSFIYLGIYWSNHHHLLHATDHVDGRILWANLYLLFWLSLIPFATNWMAESGFAMVPVALYGFLLLMAAAAYFLLVRAIIAHCDANHELRNAIGRDYKGKLSLALYILAVALAFVHQGAALALYVVVAVIWFVPDQRIERTLGHRTDRPAA